MNLEEETRLLCAEIDLDVSDPSPRTVETVALEIHTLQRQAQGIVLSYAIEIGRRLEEAKAMLSHGEWGLGSSGNWAIPTPQTRTL